jgi:hypothetical protein
VSIQLQLKLLMIGSPPFPSLVKVSSNFTTGFFRIQVWSVIVTPGCFVSHNNTAFNKCNNFLFQIIKSSKMRKNFYKKPVRFKNQNYEKLHKYYHDVLNALYSDPLFPATSSSIGSSDVGSIKWNRPRVSTIFKAAI